MHLNSQVIKTDRPDTRLQYVQLLEQDTDGRLDVEFFIHNIFSYAYGAQVNTFLPRLLALRNHENHVLAALGMRQAKTNPLFLETYLDESIETVLSNQNDSNIAREGIVEIGNLSSLKRGGLRDLIISLTAYMHGLGSEWVVFTAVPIVQKAFASMGLKLYPLMIADKSRLSEEESESWGSYYDKTPMVCASRVEDCFTRLHEAVYLESKFHTSLHLWEQAFAEGCRQRDISRLFLPRLVAEGEQ